MSFPLPPPRRHSGDVIVRMVVPLDWSAALVSWLAEFSPSPGPPTVERLVSLPWAQVFALEAVAAGTVMGPRVSLNSYWRVCMRNLPGIDPAEIVAWLKRRPEVAHVWAELQVFVAADPWSVANVVTQPFLGPAPLGVAAYAAHAKIHGAGKGAHLIALELGWNLQHVDLARHQIGTPIWGDNIATANKGAPGARFANHGTSSLGVAVGESPAVALNPPVGPVRLGVAPRVDSVRVVSCFDAATNVAEHVANAIVHAVWAATNRGADVAYDTVLLLEVQRAFLPTEVDEADFHAMRLATALGLTVIEPAGNGGTKLTDGVLSSGHANPSADGSGAVMVGALGVAGATVGPLRDSNYGPRVDCSVHAMGLRTCGRVEDRHGALARGDVNTAERTDFARTSAAAAVVAGVALAIIAYGKATGQAPTPLGVREWLKKPAQGPTGLGATVDLAALGTRPIPSVPLLLTTAKVLPKGAYKVSTPQTSEGETSLVDRGPDPDVERGIIVTPVVVGFPAYAGTPPTTNAAYTEHTVYFTDPPFLHGANVGLQYVSGTPGVGGYGVWSSQRRIDEKAAHQSGKYAPMSFQYASMPSEAAVNADPDTNLSTTDFYDIYKGGTLLGELRRCLNATPRVDHWVLFEDYTYPDVGDEVRLQRKATPAIGQTTSDTRAWLHAKRNQGGSNKPKWYVKCVFTPEPL